MYYVGVSKTDLFPNYFFEESTQIFLGHHVFFYGEANIFYERIRIVDMIFLTYLCDVPSRKYSWDSKPSRKKCLFFQLFQIEMNWFMKIDKEMLIL